MVARDSVTVDLPAGAVPGTRVGVEGAGDVLEGQTRSIEFELVGAGPRANELRFAENDFATKLDTSWAMEREAKARPRRRRKGVAAGAASALLLVLVCLVVSLWTIRTVGAPCTDDSTCWSGMCSGNTCVTECKTSRECPSDMWCAPVGPRSTCLPRHN
ncbi:MAG TPA: hypothetical protein VM925_27505 [Labilithrix sp.]|nr:hypothetical protein [Labilithrix sp.]